MTSHGHLVDIIILIRTGTLFPLMLTTTVQQYYTLNTNVM